jgi:ketosteroid isomerase-like protein
VSSAPDARHLVEDAYRIWNARGPRAFIELTTESVELHDPPELPDAEAWIGRDAVVARLEDVVAVTGGRWADIEYVLALTDEVLVSLNWRVERGGPALAPVYHVVRVEGGSISRIRVFLDEAAARSAAAES